MSGRYINWHHKRGDFESAPSWLIDEGQKLLGYLQRQRELSGVKTVGAAKEFPDGFSVRAMFFGDIPIVEYRVGGGEKVGSEVFIESFVITPTDEGRPFALDAHNEEVLDSAHGWFAWVFDVAHLDPTQHNHVTPPAVKLYVPPFPATDLSTTPPEKGGIGYYGNVDWRNADESIAVSWYGPRSRYFDEREIDGSAAGVTGVSKKQPWIFCKGRKILDFSTHEAAILGVTGTFIAGVAVQGSTLLFVATDPVTSTEYFLNAQASINISATPSVDETTITLLHTRTQPSGEVISDHPWFWNQSGTEARTIRSATGVARELIATWPSPTSLLISVVDHPATSNITVVTTGTRGVYHKIVDVPLFVWDSCTGGVPDSFTAIHTDVYPGVIGPIGPFGLFTPGPDGRSPTSFAFIDKDVTTNHAQTWVEFPIAVDYRNNVAVYAYSPAATATNVEHNTTSAFDATYTSTLSGSSTITPSYKLTYSWTASRSDTLSRSYTSTINTNYGGIKTDFFSHSSVLSKNIGLTATFSSSGSASGSAQSTIAGGVCPANIPTEPVIGVADGLGFDVDTAGGNVAGSGGGSGSCDASGTISITSAGEEAFYLLHLDLRFKSISYILLTNNDTQSNSFSVSLPVTIGPIGINTCPITIFAVIQANGVGAYTWSPVTVTVSDTPVRQFNEHVVMAGVEQEQATVSAPSVAATNYTRGFGGTLTPKGDDIAARPVSWTNGILAGIDYWLAYHNHQLVVGGTPYDYYDNGNQPTSTDYPTLQIDVVQWKVSDGLPADKTISSTLTTSADGFGLPFTPLATRIKLDLASDGCYPDNSHFLHYGGWENHKGAWIYSQVKPSAGNYMGDRTSKISDGDIRTRSGAQSYQSMFYPIWMLPKTFVSKRNPQ